MKRWFIIIGGLTLVVAGGVLAVRYGWQSGRIQQRLAREVGERLGIAAPTIPVWETALGFGKPRTYLVLFLNNTELRPGGGFIGAYAVLRFQRGVPELVKVEGTELLDGRARRVMLPSAPEPLQEYLKVDDWFFRDSNWSPDFASSSAFALELYRREGGLDSAEIDGVIGITATVLEELTRQLGQVAIAGQTWGADNIVERLEYEVEYGYRERGRKFAERKQPLGELAAALLARLQKDGWRRGRELLALGERLLAEKHLLLYAVAPDEQQALAAAGWAGRLATGAADQLAWVDANLGALKTDAAITRALRYELLVTSTSSLARATMSFTHAGKPDWRISRYRDYARVFAPAGSVFRSATTSGVLVQSGAVASGREGERQWFGVFVTLPPGGSGSLTFEYTIAPAVATAIENGSYELAIDKQPGLIAPALTVDLNFGKNLTFARPPEARAEHGDRRYRYQTDLRVSREFAVRF